MNPRKLPPLSWDTIVAVVNRGVSDLLAYIGFWKMGWWNQIFAVTFMLIAVVIVMLGPLILAAWRLFRDGDRPSLPGMVFILLSSVSGSVILLILGRILQMVVNRHPGPIL